MGQKERVCFKLVEKVITSDGELPTSMFHDPPDYIGQRNAYEVGFNIGRSAREQYSLTASSLARLNVGGRIADHPWPRAPAFYAE